MGLALSVLVFSIGVLEALSCMEHVRQSYLPLEFGRKRRRLVLDVGSGTIRHRETRRSSEFQRDPVSLLRRISRQFAPEEDETVVCEELAAIWDRVESGRVHSTEILQRDTNLLSVRDGGEEDETASRSSTPATVIHNLGAEDNNTLDETDIPFEEAFCPKCVDEKFDLLASSTHDGNDVKLGIEGACFLHDVAQNKEKNLTRKDENLLNRDSVVLHRKERTEPSTEIIHQGLILDETSDLRKETTLISSEPPDYLDHSSINDSVLIARSSEQVVELQNAVLATNQTAQTIIEKNDEKIKKEASRSEALISSDLDDCSEFKTQISNSEINSCEIPLNPSQEYAPKKELLTDYVNEKTGNDIILSKDEFSTELAYLKEEVFDISTNHPKTFIQEVTEVVSEWLGLSGDKKLTSNKVENNQNTLENRENNVFILEAAAIEQTPEKYKEENISIGQTSLIKCETGLNKHHNEPELANTPQVEPKLNIEQSEGDVSFQASESIITRESNNEHNESIRKEELGTSVEQDVLKRRLQKQNNIDIGRVNKTKEMLRTGTIVETVSNESENVKADSICIDGTEIKTNKDKEYFESSLVSPGEKDEDLSISTESVEPIQIVQIHKEVNDNVLFQSLVKETNDDPPADIVQEDMTVELASDIVLSKEMQYPLPSQVICHESDIIVNNNGQGTTEDIEISSCNIENVPPRENSSQDVRKNSGKYALQDITSELQNADVGAIQINIKTSNNNIGNSEVLEKVSDAKEIDEKNEEIVGEAVPGTSIETADTCQPVSLSIVQIYSPEASVVEERVVQEETVQDNAVAQEMEGSKNQSSVLKTVDHAMDQNTKKEVQTDDTVSKDSGIMYNSPNVENSDSKALQNILQVKDSLKPVEMEEASEKKLVKMEEASEKKHLVMEEASKKNLVEMEEASETKLVEMEEASEKNPVEMKEASETKLVEMEEASEKKLVEMEEASETKVVEMEEASKKKHVEMEKASEKRQVEMEEASEKKLVEMEEASETKLVEMEEASETKLVEMKDASEKKHAVKVSGKEVDKSPAQQEVRQLTGLEDDVTVVEGAEPPECPGFTSIEDISSPDKAFWLIFSGEYTKAMSKDWHSGHFCCWQCDESLTGQRYVLRDDHPYCIKCYEQVFANTCDECSKVIGIDSKDLSYKDKHWHEACFLCSKCRVSLVDKQFGSKADKIYCGNCYDAQFASRCDGCSQIFRAGTKKMEYKTRQWHEQCFCCCVCKTAIGTKSFIPREQEIYCAGCYEEKFATRCVKCNKIITSGGVTYKNEPWHRECFTCTNCSTSLAGQRFTSRDEKPYCADCFGELFAKRCTACCKPITGIGGTRFISFEDRHWHNDCFICASCKSSLVGRGFITDAEDILCTECAKQKLM